MSFLYILGQALPIVIGLAFLYLCVRILPPSFSKNGC